MLLAGVAWFGVLLQLWLSVRLGFANGKSLIGGLVVFAGYFTVLTNIFVALVATAGAARRNASPRPWLYRETTVGCATTAILVVGIVYHLLLRQIWSPQGAQLLADIVLHYAVPVAALLHWLIYRHDERIGRWAPLAWCSYPLAYLAYVLIRGEILASYPYPFIDVSQLGYRRVSINAAGLLAGFAGLGFVVAGLGSASRRAMKARAELSSERHE
jgi:hypothetical protein